MAEQSNELRKLTEIAIDMDLTIDIRSKALETIGKLGSHESLLALLDVAGNESMVRQEREHALKYALQIVKSGH
jgi:hypothetical protein